MTPERRAEGLAAAARCRRAALLELGETIAARGQVELVERPAPQTVMLELSSAVGAFCLGEAVVSTARVTVAGDAGFACVLGFDAEAALAAALADAAGGAAVDELAGSALADEQRERLRDDHDVAATRVTLG